MRTPDVTGRTPVRASLRYWPSAFLLALAWFVAPAMAQSPPPSVPFTVSGEVRVRSEWDSPGGGVQADLFTYLRARFGIRADISPSTHVVLQGQDSRVFGAESNTTASNPDVFDLHQGYLELNGDWQSARLAVRAGRQEIAFGNERLVGVSNWTNTGRSFDGARVMVAPKDAKAGAEPWSATVFAATVDEKGRHFGPAGTTVVDSTDHAVAGLFATGTRGIAAVDVTLLYDAGARYRRYEHADRGTLDLRLHTDTKRSLALDLEGALQQGHQRVVASGTQAAVAQDIRAWLASARLVRAPQTGRRLSGSLGVDALSGDGNAIDGTYGAFNTMYATNHQYYGLLDLLPDPTGRVTDRGFTDAYGTIGTVLHSRLSGRVELHHFAAQAGDRRPLGWEGDVVLPVRLSAFGALEAGYAAFRAGAGAPAAGLGTPERWKLWMYLQLRVGF